MKSFFLLLSSGLLLVASARAQVAFHLGPSLTGVFATAAQEGGSSDIITSRPGFEAGVLASWQRGHFALQPALRYAQRGSRQTPGPQVADGFSYDTRLHYLTLPVQLAYTQHPDGRGFQVFAGPYLGWLLGGHYTRSGGIAGQTLAGDVVGADEHTVDVGSQLPDYSFYARHLDLGAQAGVGYQLGPALWQVSYSLGLRNVATPLTYTHNGAVIGGDNPVYRNRAIQVSVSYLFGLSG